LREHTLHFGREGHQNSRLVEGDVGSLVAGGLILARIGGALWHVLRALLSIKSWPTFAAVVVHQIAAG
jgi:hypothetical protein